MKADDLRGALGVFLLVFASTFPVVLPFVFIDNLQLAMRVSAAIAIAMLFLCGYNWGRYGGHLAVVVRASSWSCSGSSSRSSSSRWAVDPPPRGRQSAERLTNVNRVAGARRGE